tara:strand:+ start:458 stop:913 length:456 start_codon:yes stop_codon:yes gene_type:complete
MPGDSWKLAPGLNHVGAYEVSGKPFCSGGINATTACKISFDAVTRWVMINNRSDTAGHDLKIGFSEAGVRADKAWTDANYTAGENYFILDNKNSATTKDRGSWLPRLELKVSELWLSGSANVDVIAGLTNIPRQRTTTANGTSWSGSNGVG